MLKILRDALLKLVEDLDAGNTNISEEDEVKVINLIREVTNPKEDFSKYKAARYLNISRATFDNYIKIGKLPKGTKKEGFKELRWYKKDLDEYIKNNKRTKV